MTERETLALKKIDQFVAQIGKLAEVNNPVLYRQLPVEGKPGVYEYKDVKLNPITYLQVVEALRYYIVSPESDVPLHKYITVFNIKPFPGCCAYAVSTGTAVKPDYQRRGINKIGIQLRQAIAAFTGYTGLVCTDVTHRIASIRTIEQAGFKNLYSLQNKRTRNRVNLYVKELEY